MAKVEYDDIIANDFMELFAPDRIGSGISRHVMTCFIDPTLVVKIECGRNSFQNIHEFEFWEYWSHYEEISKWLAPCVAISRNGKVLLQKKTTPLRKAELPKKCQCFLLI